MQANEAHAPCTNTISTPNGCDGATANLAHMASLSGRNVDQMRELARQRKGTGDENTRSLKNKRGRDWLTHAPKKEVAQHERDAGLKVERHVCTVCDRRRNQRPTIHFMAGVTVLRG